MSARREDRVLALAGIYQAALEVDRLAWSGSTGSDAAKVALDSVLVTDAADVPAVYGGVSNVRTGLEALLAQFRERRNPGRGPVPYYVAALIHLERRLSRNRELFAQLGEGLPAVQRQAEYFGAEHANTIAGMAELYASTAARAGPRILVRGDPGHLGLAPVANTVRALLLAGIRSALLWRQCGGSRWGLIFSRGALIETAERLRHTPT